MRIDVDRAVDYIEQNLCLNGTPRPVIRNILEYVNDYYDGTKPHRMLMKVLAPIGFNEETIENMLEQEIILID